MLLTVDRFQICVSTLHLSGIQSAALSSSRSSYAITGYFMDMNSCVHWLRSVTKCNREVCCDAANLTTAERKLQEETVTHEPEMLG